MRRNWIPKKVLSVILAAAMAMSPAMTALASPVDESAEVSVEAVAEDESVAEASVEADEDAAKTEDEEAEEAEAPLFEEVDPQEEGLVDPVENVEGEEITTTVEDQDPEDDGDDAADGSDLCREALDEGLASQDETCNCNDTGHDVDERILIEELEQAVCETCSPGVDETRDSHEEKQDADDELRN